MIDRRYSSFPIVLIFLTLALVVFMYYAFTGKQAENKTAITEQSAVSQSQYNEELDEIQSAFVVSYEQASDDLARLMLVEKMLSQLLAMRVPLQSKDAHLALAVELNKMAQALRASDTTSARGAFDALKKYVTD